MPFIPPERWFRPPGVDGNGNKPPEKPPGIEEPLEVTRAPGSTIFPDSPVLRWPRQGS